MKKNVSSLILLMVIGTLVFGLTACGKLKPSNLQANYHLRKANGFYLDEKFRKAVESYEKALQYNPNLKQIYFHLATSYAALYKPAKDSEINRMYGEKALDYLLKAKENNPDNIKIIHALGDMYEKLGNFEEAEKYYLTIKKNSKDNPKVYYVLANFYSNHGQHDKAEEMYKERIEEDPENPEGYHYLAGYYQGRMMWYKAAENHELRIAALIDTTIVKIQREIYQLQEHIRKINSKKLYIANIKKQTALSQEQKNEYLETAQKELAEMGTEEEAAQKIEAKQKELAEAWKLGEEKIKDFPKEKKDKIAEAYYMLGLVKWNHSYHTKPEYMGPKERLEIIQKGMDVLNKSIALKDNYWDPWSIIALLHLQKIQAEPLKEAEHRANWKKAYDKAISIRDRIQKRERLRKQLEEMGEE